MRVGIIGGSIAGLCAAHELLKVGADVHVFERSTGALEDRGAGIGLDPSTLNYLIENDALDGYLMKDTHTVLGGDDQMLWRVPGEFASTCWDLLYAGLRRQVPDERYTSGANLEQLELSSRSVTATFTGRGRHEFDLVVCADGADSQGRQLLFPDAQPQFAGYVAVRGLVEESALGGLTANDVWPIYEEALIRYLVPKSHVIMYMVPGRDIQNEGLKPGSRRLNWVWYVNVPEQELASLTTDREGNSRRLSMPPGMMSDTNRASLLSLAEDLFPGTFLEVIKATPAMFQQTIYSCMPPAISSGRVCLVGDAAHLCRPHVGSGSSLAIADGVALAQAVEKHGDRVETALSDWGKERYPAVSAMVELSRHLGEGHQVRPHDWGAMSREQFEQWWAGMMQGKWVYFDARSDTSYR
ncbi:MAG: 2,6-dihydroxypyridine 3-monooxygenase [Gammaproteobacteria bacterium]|jgi:2,6-dihydroxypyridine 3-monooxygenase